MNTSTRGQMWHDGFSQTGDQRIVRGRLDWTDVIFFLLLAVGAGYAQTRFSQSMDYYEKIILCGTVSALVWLWRPLRHLMLTCALAAGLALMLYQNGLSRAEQVFFLKFCSPRSPRFCG